MAPSAVSGLQTLWKLHTHALCLLHGGIPCGCVGGEVIRQPFVTCSDDGSWPPAAALVSSPGRVAASPDLGVCTSPEWPVGVQVWPCPFSTPPAGAMLGSAAPWCPSFRGHPALPLPRNSGAVLIGPPPASGWLPWSPFLCLAPCGCLLCVWTEA